MSSHRFLFYAPALTPGMRAVDLEGDEHHHLSRVLRAVAGEEVFVTNGRGVIAQCRIETIRPASTTLFVGAVETDQPGCRVTLALALLKKEKFAQALEQCVELGIASCIPFVAEKSHVRRYGERTVLRLRRIAVSAMKQSFRSWLPAIDDPLAFDALAKRCAGGSLVVGAQGAPGLRWPPPDRVTVVVGPEGGLTDAEIAALVSAGAVFASVSAHRLRAETAAAALVSALLQPD